MRMPAPQPSRMETPRLKKGISRPTARTAPPSDAMTCVRSSCTASHAHLQRLPPGTHDRNAAFGGHACSHAIQVRAAINLRQLMVGGKVMQSRSCLWLQPQLEKSTSMPILVIDGLFGRHAELHSLISRRCQGLLNSPTADGLALAYHSYILNVDSKAREDKDVLDHHHCHDK